MFSQLFESIPDALLMVDGDGRIVLANSHAEALFGYPAHGLKGLAVEQLMPAAARARHLAHRAGYMAEPRVRPMGDTGQALTGRRRDGGEFPVEIALSPFPSLGEVRYLASVRDVSETLRTRQALVRAGYDALVGRIGRLALEAGDDTSVIERIPALLADALDVEVVALAFLRADREELELYTAAGLDDGWDATAHALGSARAWQTLAGAGLQIAHHIAQDRARENTCESPDVADHSYGPATAPLPVAGRDGARSTVVVPLLGRDQPIGALLGLSRRPQAFNHDAVHLLQSTANLLASLMQRRRTEEQLAHAQRLDAIGQLTGGIAHDFNNLLTVVSGNLQLLEAECPLPAGASELVTNALRAANRGGELTAKLMVFARRQRLEPDAVNATRLLRDLQRMLGRTLGDTIRVQVECPEALACAHVDTMQLETALVNLALNARDAMPRGGDLTLSARECWITANDTRPALATGLYLVFSVADTGMGMSEATRTRAIEPFYTTKAVGRGSGLGLSMVYGFVRQSGGDLRIHSQLGYGTRVELLVPAAPDGAAVIAAGPAALPTGHGETLVVVEDEDEVRRVAVAFLQSLGYRVQAFADAEAALLHLRGHPGTALLFSDIMLGKGLDGRQLAQAAREILPDLPVLLTSGHEIARDAMEPADAGAAAPFDLLRKPYRREQLAAAVRRALAPPAVAGAP